MQEEIKPTIEKKKASRFWLAVSFACLSFFLFYLAYFNGFSWQYRSVADALLWTIAAFFPIVVNVWGVYYRRTLKPYSLISRMLGTYFFSILLGIALVVSYCEGEECMSTIGLVVVVTGYNVFLNSLFLYLHWARNRHLYVDA